ncbi:MAG: hypothetical protein MPW14_22405 [Candidatus Manganitrophus sp.]|nr:hypothetical protein [Candidatus Manganitrophus sp.]MDC4226053.1 hypothetical protein [Candidatus Manganitrophus sp.]WDT72691.1 MAG: hypothetical protein MPW17_07595 [Candidatus Manganitrophus sp.]WDT79842.1 MAG: hypothetical protein MPW14_22405 [Candidatus Manganitrophus sp.]
MNKIIEQLYFAAPVAVQDVLVSAYGYKLYNERYGGNHNRYLSELLASQYFNAGRIRELVDSSFIKMFRHAVENVPYYRQLVRDGRIDLQAVKSVDDLCRIPILTKEQIRNDPEAFLASGFGSGQLIKIGTSGTTGKTLTIYIDKDSRRRAYAFFSRFKAWFGIDPSLPNVTFAGRVFVEPDRKTPPFWRRNRVSNNYLFSSYHLSPATLPSYVEALLKIQPHFIDSYPSSIYTIAKYMQDNGISGIFPKAIITSSETLLEHQRRTIEEVFRCPVADQYGCAEQVVFVSQCEKGTYHVHPEFGVVEFLREDGSEAEPGEQARLVCTGFTNDAMPLIRYEMGDVGVRSSEECACGRSFPSIKQIIGRMDDTLITGDGRRIGRLDPVFKGLKSVIEAQIVQEDYENIVLYIVPGRDFQMGHAQTVVSELRKRLGSSMKVRVELVDEIARTSSGKFRAVVSKIVRAS